MSQAWKKFDLAGGGLQSANLQLARRLKKRITAYFLWLFFPTGAHAFYLAAPKRGLAYLALSLVTIASYWLFSHTLAWVPLLFLVSLASYDLFWIDQRLTAINKATRVAVYMHQGHGAPSDFRARYSDENELDTYIKTKETEKAGHLPATTTNAQTQKSAKSFAQQEAMLRALAKHKPKKKS